MERRKDAALGKFSVRLEKYHKTAQAARDSFNKEDSSMYADNASAFNARDYRCWLNKAQAIIRNGSLKENDLSKAIGAVKYAVAYAPEDCKQTVAEECYMEMKHMVADSLDRAQSSNAVIINRLQYIHTLMMQWIELITEIPCLDKSLIIKEFNECCRLCRKSQQSAIPKGRRLFAAAVKANVEGGYSEAMRRALKSKGITV